MEEFSPKCPKCSGKTHWFVNGWTCCKFPRCGGKIETDYLGDEPCLEMAKQLYARWAKQMKAHLAQSFDDNAPINPPRKVRRREDASPPVETAGAFSVNRRVGVQVKSVVRAIGARVIGDSVLPQLPEPQLADRPNPTEEGQDVLNNAVLGDVELIAYQGLYFRSYSEVRVYQELVKRSVIVFANPTATLGPVGSKKEPDFLVCCSGSWGILEVMGEKYHPSSTAMDDHDRARLFKDHGVQCIEFYDARECYNRPAAVVDDFLRRLEKR